MMAVTIPVWVGNFGLLTLFAGSAWIWGKFLDPRQSLLGDQPLQSAEGETRRVPRGAVAVVLAYLANSLLQSLLALSTDPPVVPPAFLALILTNLILSGLILFPLVWLSRGDPWGLIPNQWAACCRIGGNGFLLTVIPTVLALGLRLWWQLRINHQVPETNHPLLKLLQTTPTFANYFGVLTVAVVCAPLLEELMFRVVLQNWLCEFVSVRAAILLTALLFAAVHGLDALPLLPLSLILGLTYARSGRYLSSVITHALFNAANIAALLLSRPEGW